METLKQITIYLTNGDTLRFEKCSDIKIDKDITLPKLTFEYMSASQEGRDIKGSFILGNIAGYSISK